ncbi:MAG TPA: tRNA (adenosine(37)-N6)-threonylcarbamoyltransferase complex dimerization subunit type 1 TsaB [Sporolactobacillaceae bacterium]|nr:tRNA (adenosine(37)-N6)-threonylcarbamoyltransferase complex dimerization subunit type 1 TsaB [Sporolactobacillaceae bacterium]
MTSRVLCRVSRQLEQAAETGPVLGLDTSTQIASLAVVARGRVAGRVAHPVSSHGASLPGVVDQLLSSAGFKIRDLSAIAVGIGPGSFTGLRIGLSYAKGLAMASGCALAGVPGFDAVALAAIDHIDINVGSLLAVVVDARKKEVYAALYRVVADGLEKLTEDLLVTLEHLASRITEHITEDIMFIGDSTAKDAAALVSTKGHRAAVFETGTLDIRGVSVAAIGAARFACGEMDRVASLEPLYIRTPEATFKPNLKSPAGIGTEGVWSIERKNSFGNI